MSLLSFINEISPTGEEIDGVQKSGNYIREALQNKMSEIKDNFLAGSFKRRTKNSPINDLDIFFKFDGGSGFFEETNDGCIIYITEDQYNNDHVLNDFSSHNPLKKRYEVSPIRILNYFREKIKETYSTTGEIGRNGECVTSYLSTYDLTIDCVPFFAVKEEDYILIPKGENNIYRKKTNPKMDEEKVNTLNNETHYNGKLKGLIKVLKYRNQNKNYGVSFKSYILECLVYHALNIHSQHEDTYSNLFKVVINYIYSNVDQYCNIQDLPGYEYMYYTLSTDQKKTIKDLLILLEEKINISEDSLIDYLKS